MSKKYNVAVVGANGAVGEEILAILAEVNFPINKLVPLASSRSAGKTVTFAGRDIVIKELTDTVFEEEEIEIALFSAGGSVSAQFAPSAVRAGAVVIDNTSHFRMDAKALEQSGITEGTIRLSIGLENPDDLIADLQKALKTAEKTKA